MAAARRGTASARAALAGAALLLLGATVWPRREFRVDGPNTYFDEIALLGTVEALRTDAEQAGDEDRTLVQLLAVSRLVRRKYPLVRAAMLSAGAAVALVVAAALASGPLSPPSGVSPALPPNARKHGYVT